MSNSKIHTKGLLALILLAFIFASMGVFARYLNTDYTILQQTYLRVFAAFILGLLLFSNDVQYKKIRSIPKKDWIILIFRSIALYLIAVTFFSYAIVNAKFSNVSFISAIPVTALFGFVFLKEKVTREKVLYIVLSFIGVILIAVHDFSNIFNWGKGEIFVFFASVFFAISYIARKWQSEYLNNKETTLLIFFISILLLFITSLFFAEGLPSTDSFTLPTLLVIFGAGLFNVANLLLTNYGFKHVEAVLAGNILSLEVVFAIVIGFIFYGEILTVKELFGGLLIVYSVYRMNTIK